MKRDPGQHQATSTTNRKVFSAAENQLSPDVKPTELCSGLPRDNPSSPWTAPTTLDRQQLETPDTPSTEWHTLEPSQPVNYINLQCPRCHIHNTYVLTCAVCGFVDWEFPHPTSGNDTLAPLHEPTYGALASSPPAS